MDLINHSPVAGPLNNLVPNLRAPTRLPAGTRLVTMAVVILPFIGLAAAAALLWGTGFHWVELGVFVAMTTLTGLGVTAGYHRYFTHRSFRTNKVIEFLLAAFGSMAIEGPLLKWVAQHRQHHQHSDAHGDPHSPHHHGGGPLGVLRGFWHAHIGWFFAPDAPELSRYVKDLAQSRMLRWVDGTFLLWVFAGLVIPTVMAGLLLWSWQGLLLGLIWGGLVRTLIVHHVTWSINSVCHLWGRQPYEGGDQSRNNFIFGVLGFGEGWHNNHHAFPTSARHGLRWWQFDFSYCVIRALELTGLVWDVKRPPSRELMA